MYHNGMPVLKKIPNGKHKPAEGAARARTRKLMLDAAVELMQSGLTPSVNGVAGVAGVSRATAYRYFASEAELVHAVVDEALGPILDWSPTGANVAERVADLLATAIPRIDEFEATFKASLRLSLEQWARRRAGTLGAEPLFTRGHRIDLMMNATAPIAGAVTPSQHLRLAQALSLVYGVEVLNVLKDIWGLSVTEAQGVAQWAAAALIKAAEGEASQGEPARNTIAVDRTQDAAAVRARKGN